jgi:hypothetical protein
MTYEDPISDDPGCLKLCKSCEDDTHMTSAINEEDRLIDFEDNLDSNPSLRNYHQSALHMAFLSKATTDFGGLIGRFDEFNFEHVMRLLDLKRELYRVMMKISIQLYNLERISKMIKETNRYKNNF